MLSPRYLWLNNSYVLWQGELLLLAALSWERCQYLTEIVTFLHRSASRLPLEEMSANTQPLYTQFTLKIPGKYEVTQIVTQNFHALKKKNMQGTRNAVEMENWLGKLGVKLPNSDGKDKTLPKKMYTRKTLINSILLYKILANTVGLKSEFSKQPNKLFPYKHQIYLIICIFRTLETRNPFRMWVYWRFERLPGCGCVTLVMGVIVCSAHDWLILGQK